jgi:hypothetical protein
MHLTEEEEISRERKQDDRIGLTFLVIEHQTRLIAG